jgi:hypothetical protein
MASGRRHRTTTKQSALEKVEPGLERLSTREANLIRMVHGIDVEPDAKVGEPAEGCNAETIRRVRAIEKRIFERARQRRRSAGSVKAKIVRKLKKEE